MLELLSTYQNEIIYVYNFGLIFSLLVRFIIVTSCIYITNNTRFKELKNLTNRVIVSSLKRSYMSILWPYELIDHIISNVRHFLKK
jgi:hypothetical protein